MAVSRDDGLTSKQLASVTGIPQSETDRILQVCSQYLSSSGPEGPFRIYHQSFREFLLSDKTFRIYPAEVHWAIRLFYIEEYQDAWLQCDEDYALLHTLTHLAESLRSATRRKQEQIIKDALANLLTELGFLERKTVRIGIDAVRSDLWSAIDMALLEPETTAVLKSILCILDSEAKVLGGWDHDRHPHFFVQQIYLRSARLKATPAAKLCEEHLRRTAAAYLKYVWMTECDSAELERTLVGQRSNPVVRVAATPDGRWIVSQTSANEVSVWELKTGSEVHRLGQGRSRDTWRRSPIAVVLTRDSRYAILEESAYWLTVWNLKSGKSVQSVHIPVLRPRVQRRKPGCGRSAKAACFIGVDMGGKCSTSGRSNPKERLISLPKGLPRRRLQQTGAIWFMAAMMERSTFQTWSIANRAARCEAACSLDICNAS